MELAAAAMGVGSIAIQLTETINELHSFWKTIQDAPADTIELFNELEALCSVLVDIKGS